MRLAWRSRAKTFNSVVTLDPNRLRLTPLGPQEEVASNVETINAKLADWLRNIRANTRAIVDRCEWPLPRYKGPAVAVGGSSPNTPLLASNVMDLPRGGGFTVFACDRAVPQIRGWGRPDVVLYLESNRDPHYEWLMADSGLALHAELWCPPFAHPDVVRAYSAAGGIVRWFHVHYPLEIENFQRIMEALLPPMHTLWTGGNVGLTTFFAAVSRGCNPVALVGYDFCDTLPDGKLVTSKLMQQWALDVAKVAGWAKYVGIDVFDCTGGGLLPHTGLKSMDLKEFVNAYGDGVG